MYIRDMVNILCEVIFLILMKTVKIMSTGGKGCMEMDKGLMEESGTYGTSGVLWGYS